MHHRPSIRQRRVCRADMGLIVLGLVTLAVVLVPLIGAAILSWAGCFDPITLRCRQPGWSRTSLAQRQVARGGQTRMEKSEFGPRPEYRIRKFPKKITFATPPFIQEPKKMSD